MGATVVAVTGIPMQECRNERLLRDTRRDWRRCLRFMFLFFSVDLAKQILFRPSKHKRLHDAVVMLLGQEAH